MYSPPTAGGYRSKSKIRLFEKWYSPPAYGGYRHEPAHSDAHLLYSPACGGYRLDPVPGENWLNSIPPRVRGLSVPCTKTLVVATYSPPHAGVIGRFGFCETGAGRIPPRLRGLSGMSENHCESVVYSLSMRGYRHRNRNGGAFVMCPYKQMGLLQSRKVTFLDNPLSAIFLSRRVLPPWQVGGEFELTR